MANPNSASEVIRASLILVGAISQDEQPSASEAQDGLNRLINMLESWSADQLDIFTVSRSVFALGTKQIYTAGPGGDWDMPYPPPHIEDAYCQITDTSPVSEIQMKIYTEAEFARIPVKLTTSTIPRGLYNDRAWPLANIYLYPVPTGVNNIVLYMWQQLTGLASLTDTISFPPGYALAIIFNLATVLAPFYGAKLSDDVKTNALIYKSRIERQNLPDYLLECDAAVQSRAQVFNWLTGEPT